MCYGINRTGGWLPAFLPRRGYAAVTHGPWRHTQCPQFFTVKLNPAGSIRHRSDGTFFGGMHDSKLLERRAIEAHRRLAVINDRRDLVRCLEDEFVDADAGLVVWQISARPAPRTSAPSRHGSGSSTTTCCDRPTLPTTRTSLFAASTATMSMCCPRTRTPSTSTRRRGTRGPRLRYLYSTHAMRNRDFASSSQRSGPAASSLATRMSSQKKHLCPQILRLWLGI